MAVETIKPLKRLPEKFRIPGDYNRTMASLFCAVLSGKECTLTNYNRAGDLFELIELLEKTGFQISRNATELKIYASPEVAFEECAFIEFGAGVQPLTLLLGYLIGKRRDCTIRYGQEINQDLIDRIVDYLSKRGIDLFHESDERTLVYRAGSLVPMECRVNSALPYLKNVLMMMALSSDISLLIQEDAVSAGVLEWALEAFGVPVEIKDIKSCWVVDPEDPRKKKLVADAEWKREIRIGRTHTIPEAEVDIPSDTAAALALMSLIVLKKKKATLVNVYLDDNLKRFRNLLSSAGIDIEKKNSRNISYGTLADLVISPKRPKPRKLSGENAQALIEQVPFLALIMGLADGKTIIRDISEYNSWANSPFVEISTGLERLGVKAGAIEDGLIIEGGKELDSDSFGPFRNRNNALAFYMAALAGKAKSEFHSFELVRDNFGELVSEINESSENEMISYIRS